MRDPANTVQAPSLGTQPAVTFAIFEIIRSGSVYVSSFGSYEFYDLLFAGCAVIILVSIESSLIHLVSFRSGVRNWFVEKAVIFVLTSVNSFYFIFVLTSWSAAQFLVYAVATGLFSIAIARQSLTNVILLCSLFPGLSTVSRLKEEFLHRKQSYTVADSTFSGREKASRNLYLIGFDGLVSPDAMQGVFGLTGMKFYSKLESLGFRLFSGESPGDQTLTSYASWIAGFEVSSARVAKPYISGTRGTAFWGRAKAIGYSTQFIYQDDYFGTGRGRIDDKPARDGSLLSSCGFQDRRWAFYACSLAGASEVAETASKSVWAQYANFSRRLKARGSGRWVSVGHIWYPGHTVGQYNGEDSIQFNAYKKQYSAALDTVMIVVEQLVSDIRSVDSGAVIAIFGDHGPYALRVSGAIKHHETEGERVRRTLDSRGILFAVSGWSQCNDFIFDVPTRAFLQLLACASK